MTTIDTSTAAVTALIAERDALAAEAERLRKQRDQAEARYTTVCAMLDRTHTRAEKAEAERDALAAEVESMRKQRDQAESKYITVFGMFDRTHARAEKSEARVAKLMAALEDIADPKRLTSHGDPVVLRDHAKAAIAADKGASA